MPITIFAIHSNHENRLTNIPTCKTKEFNAKNQFIMFDYINNEFSVYKNENWHKEGYLHIIDGQVYCIDKKEDKIVIEKCTFAKV